jgi:chromosome segregation ATPase
MMAVGDLDLPNSLAELQAERRKRFEVLKKHIDETNAKCAPIKARLAEANAKAEEARVAAVKIAEELSVARGGEQWFVVKKEFGDLAKKLGGL